MRRWGVSFWEAAGAQVITATECHMSCISTYVTAFMGSVVFCVGRCLPVLLDALFATTANDETVISHLNSLDVAGMM